MATILEQYRKRQNDIREQIAANSLPLDQVLIMQELNYRICVLETFESLCKSAPVTMDTKSMGFHFQLVDAYVRFTLNERKFGPKTDAEGQKKRETALQSFTQVVQDGRKRFSSFNASTQEQYKTLSLIHIYDCISWKQCDCFRTEAGSPKSFFGLRVWLLYNHK